MDEGRPKVPAELRDVAYTAIGLAVLGLQRMQVLRRDVERLAKDARRRIETYEGASAER